jgi:hypothetical protein
MILFTGAALFLGRARDVLTPDVKKEYQADLLDLCRQVPLEVIQQGMTV